jgi:hypothetical protein
MTQRLPAGVISYPSYPCLFLAVFVGPTRAVTNASNPSGLRETVYKLELRILGMPGRRSPWSTRDVCLNRGVFPSSE